MKPREYCPPPCTVCTALRPAGNYSRVYGTRKDSSAIIRYVKCSYCGNTYKAVEMVAQ